jgi:hypothetical protein
MSGCVNVAGELSAVDGVGADVGHSGGGCAGGYGNRVRSEFVPAPGAVILSAYWNFTAETQRAEFS